MIVAKDKKFLGRWRKIGKSFFNGMADFFRLYKMDNRCA